MDGDVPRIEVVETYVPPTYVGNLKLYQQAVKAPPTDAKYSPWAAPIRCFFPPSHRLRSDLAIIR